MTDETDEHGAARAAMTPTTPPVEHTDTARAHPEQSRQFPFPVPIGQRGMVAEMYKFSGPLPPPPVLAAYGKVSPDLIERIVAMSERQANHRQDIEVQVVNAQLGNAVRGQVFGLVVGLAGFSTAAYLAHLGYAAAAVIAVVTNLTALAGVFVYGQAQQKERSTPELTERSDDSVPESG